MLAICTSQTFSVFLLHGFSCLQANTKQFADCNFMSHTGSSEQTLGFCYCFTSQLLVTTCRRQLYRQLFCNDSYSVCINPTSNETSAGADMDDKLFQFWVKFVVKCYSVSDPVHQLFLSVKTSRKLHEIISNNL